MTLFDLIHLIFHFLVVGAYLYLLLIVLYQKIIFPRWVFYSLIVVCLTMVYNLLHQATKGTFIFGEITIFRLTQLPFWVITNVLIFFVLKYYIKR